jgi:hypothetical protein
MPPAKFGWLGKLNKAGLPPASLLRAESPRAETAGTAWTLKGWPRECDISAAAEDLTLEHTPSDRVNQAYALTAEEIALMWQTAPPRMPIPPAGP